MTQELLSGLNGYNIPCRHTIQGGESMVCLITHGFGSSKDSPPPSCWPGSSPGTASAPWHWTSPLTGTARWTGTL